MELEKSIKILTKAKWSYGNTILKINGISIGILIGAAAALYIYHRLLGLQYDRTTYTYPDLGFHLQCGKYWPLKNLCDFAQIETAFDCIEAAEKLCARSNISFYLMLTLVMLIIPLIVSIIGAYLIRPVREYKNHSLEDINSEDQAFLLKVAQKYDLTINLKTSISEALSICTKKLANENTNTSSQLFNSQQSNYGSGRTSDVEEFHLTL